MAITQEHLELTKSNFMRLLSFLGLAAQLEVKSDDESIRLRVLTDEPGRLIGRKGQTLHALQHLLNSILLTSQHPFPKVMIDVEGSGDSESPRRGGGRERNVEKKPDLRQRVADGVREVKRWGEGVTLPEISEGDCQEAVRIAQEDPEIEAVATGRGAEAKVMLRLRKGR